MGNKVEATIDDLYKVEGRAELVNGKIVFIPRSGLLANYVEEKIISSLSRYEKTTRRGYSLTGGTAFVVNLPHRKSFSPDVAFFTGKLTMKFPEGAPILAVEVRNKDEYGVRAEREITQKRTDYFAAGTLVVWDVDLLSDDVVRVYRAADPSAPTVYKRGQLAEAEPALPGWSMPIDELFLPADES